MTKVRIERMTGKRVAVLTPFADMSNVGKDSLEVVKALRKAGYRVDVFSMLHGPMEEEYGKMGVSFFVDKNLAKTPLPRTTWYTKYDLIIVNSTVMAGCFGEPTKKVPAVWRLQEGEDVLKQFFQKDKKLNLYNENVCVMAASIGASNGWIEYVRPDRNWGVSLVWGGTSNFEEKFIEEVNEHLQRHKKTPPTISVVIPVHNGERYLRTSIESVLSQTFQDFELILVDDGSTDNTAAIMEEYAQNDSRIRIITNDTNKNIPASLNIGFQEAKGKYLTCSSDDNMFALNAFEKMVQYLDENSDKDYVVARMMLIDDYGRFERVFSEYDAKELWKNNVLGSCYLYRREAAEKIGTFDESLFLVEDYDYALRSLEVCGPAGVIDDILYKYRRQKNSLSATRGRDVKKILLETRKKHLPYILSGLADDIPALYELYQFFVSCGEEQYAQEKMNPRLRGIEKEVFDFPDGEYIVLGTGSQADEVLSFAGDKVKYIADINPYTVGKKKAGRPIISFDEVMERLNNGAMLMIAVPVEETCEVIRQATVYGLKEYRTYWTYKTLMGDK